MLPDCRVPLPPAHVSVDRWKKEKNLLLVSMLPYSKLFDYTILWQDIIILVEAVKLVSNNI